jgi:hypothetical protein
VLHSIISYFSSTFLIVLKRSWQAMAIILLIVAEHSEYETHQETVHPLLQKLNGHIPYWIDINGISEAWIASD